MTLLNKGRSYEQRRNKGGASGALALVAIHVGAQNNYKN
jgi:hypothetical protein